MSDENQKAETELAKARREYKDRKRYSAPVVASGFWVGFAMLVIAFWGEPDLRGALIKFLEANSFN